MEDKVQYRIKSQMLNNSAIAFYRRLDQTLTQLDFSLSLASHDPNEIRDKLNSPDAQAFYNLLLSERKRVDSARKPVCEARPGVAELGDTAILDQLNGICLNLEIGDTLNDRTGGLGTSAMATLATQNGLAKTLRNDVVLKVKSLESRLR